MSITLAELTARCGRDVYEHIMADFGEDLIPVLDGPQSQGDVRIRPLGSTRGVRVNSNATWTEVPPAGVEVVQAAPGGHNHVLVADPGTCRWTTDVRDSEGLAVGVFEATDTAWLTHAEHGGTGIAAGTYTVRRQREQADVQRMVAD